MGFERCVRAVVTGFEWCFQRSQTGFKRGACGVDTAYIIRKVHRL